MASITSRYIVFLQRHRMQSVTKRPSIILQTNMQIQYVTVLSYLILTHKVCMVLVMLKWVIEREPRSLVLIHSILLQNKGKGKLSSPHSFSLIRVLYGYYAGDTLAEKCKLWKTNPWTPDKTTKDGYHLEKHQGGQCVQSTAAQT